MTGSLLLNRQHSTATVYPIKNKTTRRKLRRCSSADEQSSFEILSNEKMFTKFEPTSSDNDSGIEDFDQQVVNCVRERTNEEEERSSQCFGACEDEDVEEELTPTVDQGFQYPEQQGVEGILNVRK
jgi:hypothetical protein